MIDSDLYAFNDEIELSDEELGGLRGRYTGGNQITYFGVEMYTKVASNTGRITTAGIEFATNIVSSTAIRPTVTVYHSSTAAVEGAGGSSFGANNLTSISSDGLDNIEGVSQSIQIAGDLNEVSNELAIDISSDVGGPESFFSDRGEVSSNFDGPGTKSITGDAGTTTTFSLNKDGFGYTVALPGDIEVSQNVRNAAQNQANGISQRVQISSNQYQVSNVINIVARQQQVANGLQRPELGTALSSLRGLQSIGRL
ncbi:hypothetical protein [Sulfuriflexus mobilis]|uniref:hypothetical protein n=1 Tax=Sulfuriflexus mobilis TaxID=1811807 RepID=UPI000F837644|nr:hypothetical protein [Sulfuriflexus mobilis]